MSLSTVRVERVIRAEAQQIFDIVADPRQHPLIDGSGSVRRAHDGNPVRLTLGARFGMDMKIGAAYKITNEVVEFTEGRRIAWRHFNGHIWRYVLEPFDPPGGGTRVCEEWDPSQAGHHLFLRLMRAPSRNREGMRRTLANLADRLEPPGPVPSDPVPPGPVPPRPV